MSDDDTITISKKDLAARDRKASEFDELKRKYDALSSGGSSNSAFTKEHQDELGELYEPMKALVETSMGAVSNNIQTNFDKMNTAMSDMQKQMQTQGSNFFGSVASSTLKNYDKVKGTEEFEAVLDKKIIGTNLTFRDTWKDAEERKDLNVMQEIVDLSFESFEKNNEEKPEQKPNYEPSGGTSAEGIVNSNFKYKASDLATKVEQMKSGDITSDELDEWESEFNKAVDQGLVLNDLEQSD